MEIKYILLMSICWFLSSYFGGFVSAWSEDKRKGVPKMKSLPPAPERESIYRTEEKISKEEEKIFWDWEAIHGYNPENCGLHKNNIISSIEFTQFYHDNINKYDCPENRDDCSLNRNRPKFPDNRS